MSRKQAKHDLDALLLDMQWDQEVAPLAHFLNLTPDKLQNMYTNSARIKQKAPIDDIRWFQRDVSLYLEAIQGKKGMERLASEDLDRLAESLTGKLGGTRNKVIFRDNLQVRVDLAADKLVDNLWADFICFFLSRDDWMDKLGKCPQCEKWFGKSRKNQIYCSTSCKNTVAYHRHQDERKSERRQRYRKGKPI